MNHKVVSFGEFVNEGKGVLKTLVGKDQDEDLTTSDAKTIGKKISKMHGKDRQKFIGIVNFMGASCKIFNTIWANYKPVDKARKTQNDKKDFEKEMPATV